MNRVVVIVMQYLQTKISKTHAQGGFFKIERMSGVSRLRLNISSSGG